MGQPPDRRRPAVVRPFWDRAAEIPTGAGKDAQFVEGAVNALRDTRTRSIGAAVAGWMLMEAAHATAASGDNGTADE